MKPKISAQEFEEARGLMSVRGFSSKDRDYVQTLFHGSMAEGGNVHHEGIDREELRRGIDWLKENRGKHSLSDTKIGHLETIFEKHLRD